MTDSFVVLYGQFSLTPGGADEPDVWGHIHKVRALRWRWCLTIDGEIVRGPGHALTERGARRACITAAWWPQRRAAA